MTLLWAALAALTLVGAVCVIVAREMTRMLLGLGVFLLGVAGLYAYYGFELLAVAELYVYVGGVLVLFLFAITAIGRDREGRDIGRAFDISALVVSGSVGAAVAVALWTALPANEAAIGATVEKAGTALLGSLLPQFELVGLLLLAALAAALAVVGGGERR